MGRKFRMYCVDVDGDGSEFELIFEMNGRVVDIKTEYCFEDILSISSNFYIKNCEKYNFDSRNDKMEIDICYIF